MNAFLATGVFIWSLRGVVVVAIIAFVGSMIYDFFKSGDSGASK